MKCNVSQTEAFLKGVRRTGRRPNISKFFKADGLAYIGQRLGLSAAIEAGGGLSGCSIQKHPREGKQRCQRAKRSCCWEWCFLR
ncbi:hypothetical protein BCEP4_40070 [Burkholderia cepacia]|nr:hypothetical protein BCEP4_40070 [Burkholderia cepacia]